jgi:hypothetical protein
VDLVQRLTARDGMTTDQIIIYLHEALRQAKALDDWHKFGEGYQTLRTDLERLVKLLEADDERA